MNMFDRLTELANSCSDSVVGLKLTTGEFIIGCVTNSGVTGKPQWLTKPIQVVSTQQGVHFIPWLISMDENYELEDLLAHTITMASVPQNLVDAYMEQSGQRRVLAPAGARGGKPQILVN